jgi:hypothetical protein
MKHTDLLILFVWLYVNIGAGLLTFRGDALHRPLHRFIAWAMWPFYFNVWSIKAKEPWE